MPDCNGAQRLFSLRSSRDSSRETSRTLNPHVSCCCAGGQVNNCLAIREASDLASDAVETLSTCSAALGRSGPIAVFRGPGTRVESAAFWAPAITGINSRKTRRKPGPRTRGLIGCTSSPYPSWLRFATHTATRARRLELTCRTVEYTGRK